MKARNAFGVLIVAVAAACGTNSVPASLTAALPTTHPTAQPTPDETALPTSPAPTTMCGRPRCPTTAPVVSPGPLFDGSLYGWRIAPTSVLEREGYARSLTLDCEARRYGPGHKTDLDFPQGYVPKGAASTGVEKWACGSMGVSVTEAFSFAAYPGSSATVYRALWASRSADLHAPADAVRACEIASLPAVCVDESYQGFVDRGLDRIIVFEDRKLDPHAVLLRLEGDELPFAELLQMAEQLATR